MSILGRPAAPPFRQQEALVWQGQPCWRTLAARMCHIRVVGLYLCALVLANAIAARMQHLSPGDAARAMAPVLMICAALFAGVALFAWATARTTLYTVTNQRVILQYGLALSATLALPMRMIAAVAASPGLQADAVIRLRPGGGVAYAKLWPHVRPWQFARPEPMLRAVPSAAAVALSQAVAQAQAGAEAQAQVGVQPVTLAAA